VLPRHFVWRQARTALVMPATHDGLLISEILGELGLEVAAFAKNVSFSTVPFAFVGQR
jgi:hypothetical protein